MCAHTSKPVGFLGELESSSDFPGIDLVNGTSDSYDARCTIDEKYVESVASPSSRPPSIQEPRMSTLPFGHPRPHLPTRSSLRTVGRGDSTRSVGFSTVQTRVFEVMDERPEPDLDDEEDFPDALCNSRDVRWRFDETCCDIDAHESRKIPIHERDDHWGDMHRKKIQDRILKDMCKKKEQTLKKEKEEFKSKFLRMISKGGRAALYLVSPIQKNLNAN